MPELPEVETVKNGLAPYMEAKTILAIWQSHKPMRNQSQPELAGILSQNTIMRLDRRGKYLLFRLKSNHSLVLHLGMSGSCRILSHEDHEDGKTQIDSRPKHTHLELTLEGQKRMRFVDPRRFGRFDLFSTLKNDQIPMLQSMGIEPFSNGFNQHYLKDRLHQKKTSIKSALLDQTIIAGLGNIYVCEALWDAGISPITKAGALTENQLEPLTGAIRNVLTRAIQSGGSSLKDHVNIDGELGYFQHYFNAYEQAGQICKKPNCAGIIKRIVQSGRSSYYCPRHQL